MRDRRPDLWRDSDFLKLWLGQAISLFGSQITTLAPPLTAVLLLDATPAQFAMPCGPRLAGLRIQSTMIAEVA
ncbi:MAG: hypothetical protein U0841_05780 [Chloroflexia bacterium]